MTAAFGGLIALATILATVALFRAKRHATSAAVFLAIGYVAVGCACILAGMSGLTVTL